MRYDEADDRSLIELREQIIIDWQCMGQLIKNLRLFTPSSPSCISGLFFSFFRVSVTQKTESSSKILI